MRAATIRSPCSEIGLPSAWLPTLAKHIAPYLGRVSLGDLTTPLIQNWRAPGCLLMGSQVMVAKAYLLLRAVLCTGL
ncbi:MAG: hypothetical protein J2P17_35840 [Mycobacterium sp.]|nr:hypothetical protein [Mycobacterium sp.]